MSWTHALNPLHDFCDKIIKPTNLNAVYKLRQNLKTLKLDKD